MNKIFRRLTLPVKLMLVAIIPLLFLVFITLQLYKEKNQKLSILNGYRNKIDESQQLINLTANLQSELKFSYIHNFQKDSIAELIRQRTITDLSIKEVEQKGDSLLDGFTTYTFLNQLPGIRAEVDSGHLSADKITSSYINAIYRLNTLAGITTIENNYLRSINRRLIGQKVLSEMITFLGIMRSTIYNALYHHQKNIGSLYSLRGMYDMYQSYEKELLATASPGTIQAYNKILQDSLLHPTTTYIEQLLNTYSLDNTYSAETWWTQSSAAIDELTTIQKQLRTKVDRQINTLYISEVKTWKLTLALLIIGLVIITAMVFYTIYIITRMLKEMKEAAQKIATGISGEIQFKDYPQDVMGSLADSIIKIDENNELLANTAYAIGKGNFNVPVKLRSTRDKLGNAILEMKEKLKQFTVQEKLKQQEITRAMLRAQEKERTHIGEELHDNINQLLTSVNLYLSVIASEQERREELIPKTRKILSTAIEEIRKLSRTLVAPSLMMQSLRVAIKDLVADLSVTTSLLFHIDLKEGVEEMLEEEYKVVLYRMVQELTTNIIKYAGASTVHLSLDHNEKEVVLKVSDDGKGFDPNSVKKGTGLSNIFHRAATFNGRVEIETAPGKGCCIKIFLDNEGMAHEFSNKNILDRNPLKITA